MRLGYAGIDIGGTRIKLGMADECGNLRAIEVIECSRYCARAPFLDAITSTLQAQAVRFGFTIGSAGVGCPGRIDHRTGTVIWLKSKLEFLEGLSLAEALSDRLGCPVACDNDVNAILAGEMLFGAGQGYKDVVALTVGTGIGGAISVDGKIVRGRNWATGHFGYMSHEVDGIPHVCGNCGIAEEHCSQSGMQRQLEAALAGGERSCLADLISGDQMPGLREIFEASDTGDSLAMRLTQRFTREMGMLTANLIYALDPEAILVGGGLISHRSETLDEIRAEANRRVRYLPPGATAILPMALGDSSGVMGGVALAIGRINDVSAVS